MPTRMHALVTWGEVGIMKYTLDVMVKMEMLQKPELFQKLGLLLPAKTEFQRFWNHVHEPSRLDQMYAK